MTQFFRPAAEPPATWRTLAVHLGVIALVLGIGTAIGTTVRPDDWYSTLQKPSFTPPPWVFGPVWTVLYVLIGWAGARKLLYGGARGLWVGQMVLNFLWTPVFFGLQQPLAGFAIILGMLALILWFIAWEWGRDRLSAVLFLPYAAWVALASAVNGGIVWLN